MGKHRMQPLSLSSDYSIGSITNTSTTGITSTSGTNNSNSDKLTNNTLKEENPKSTGNTTDDMTYRKYLLHEKLLELDCFADETDVLNFEYVVQQSMIDPTLSIFVPTPNDDDDKYNYNNNDYETNNNNNRITGIQKYGKSSIKTCQTFYYPKRNTNTDTSRNIQSSLPPLSERVTLKIAAARTARQIEFLYQRHKAQQTVWIRNHHDDISQLQQQQQQQPTPETNDAANIRSDNARRQIRNYHPFVVVLDNLRSAQNVGSIYRTADATKCQQVITIGITPNPCTGNGIQKVQKSSLGAEMYVPTQHFSNATTALQYIDQTYPSYQIVCVETTSESIPYTELRYENTFQSSDGHKNNDGCKNGMVFIFGNEVTGVDVAFYMSQMTKMNHLSSRTHLTDEDQRARIHNNDDSMNVLQEISQQPQLSPERAATTTIEPERRILRMIEIPMYGTKNSLNVAVCVSIILYEMIRQYNKNSVNQVATVPREV